MIQFFHVYKEYGRAHALTDVSMEIDKSEFVYLTGASGAGKSTLLRLIFGAERPSSGQVMVAGRNVGRLEQNSIPHLRRNIGVVFQDFKLLPTLSIERNVAIALEVLDYPPEIVTPRCFNMLKAMGLAHKRNAKPQELSGGEQQRVAIARALVNEPQILLADEPTGNLDNERASEILDLIHETNTRGTTVIFATHDSSLLERHPKRVIRLERGRLIS